MIRFDPASFRDPAGRVFYVESHPDCVWRILTAAAQNNLHKVDRSGLLADLTASHLVVGGAFVSDDELRRAGLEAGTRVFAQPKIPFVSYSYEWSFEMLRDAALTTLAVMDRALSAGFVLKDATAFNVIFDGAHPKLVDLPSIEPYVEGEVWAAYGQFCRSFLFPLLLAAHRDLDLQVLLRGTFGEVPVSFVSRVFGPFDYIRSGVLKDVVLQARLETTFGKRTESVRHATANGVYSKPLLVANVRRLTRIIERLKLPSQASEWSSYQAECTYSEGDRETKRAFVAEAVTPRRPHFLVDIGCNTGEYSRLALPSALHVIGIDLDSRSIDAWYRGAGGNAALSPVVGNLVNPTPAMGWGLTERGSLLDRVRGDMFLALAVVHHLRITGGIPLAAILDQLFAIAPEGVVEWVDKSDPQVKRMLLLRPDVYTDFTWPTFEALLSERATLVKVQSTNGGNRRLCHVRRRKPFEAAS